MRARSAVARISDGGDGERRTGRERDLRHRALPALVIARDQPLAVGEDRVLVLHHAVRRQAAVALGEIHRPAREQDAQAETLGGGDLDVDAVFEAGGKDVVMVGGGGAAGEHQFGHGDGGGEIERLGRQPRPHRIERLQPGEQLAVERGRQRAGERLVEMVMGVDEAGQHDVVAGFVRSWRRRFAARGRRRPIRRSWPSLTTTPRSAPSARIASGSLIQMVSLIALPQCPWRSYPAMQVRDQRRAAWT